MTQPPDLPPYNPYATPPQPPAAPPNPYAQNPYAAPNAALMSPSQQVVRLASRGSRLGAAILDGLIYMVPMVFIFAGMGASGVFSGSTDEMFSEKFGLWWGLLGLWWLGVLVVNCMFLHQNGQTIAKKMLGIKVIQVDGSRVELWRFFFLRYLPILLMTQVLSIIATIIDSVFIFGNEQRCLHDLIANTIVVEA
jgi:uncharacterized RDD family membrane protein YckC